MMKNSQHTVVQESDDVELAVVRQAMQLAKRQSDNVSMKTLTKLEQGRAKAVAAHLEHAKQENVTQSGGGLMFLSGFAPYFRQPKALFLAALLALLTILSVQQYSHQQQLENSDALLLAAELPPEAFADKEFNQWVELAGR